MKRLASIGSILLVFALNATAQQSASTAIVNVFLGTSSDHGQLSPAASYPFSMLDIGPQTYPATHTGYDHRAKVFLGFTHGRLEGVGCQGSGGNLLIKPFTGKPDNELLKKTETASPGYYAVSFTNGIHCKFTLKNKSGIEAYHFPAGKHGFYIDLAHTLHNRFIAEAHQVGKHTLTGWIESGTTCNMGAYRIYYALQFDQPIRFRDSTAHTFTINTDQPDVIVRIAFSSVSTTYAQADLTQLSFEQVRRASQGAWHYQLSHIRVKGDKKEEQLFYSLLYRCFQAPFDITEPDGTYRGSDGKVYHTQTKAYSGWSVWDNYKTALPLLSILSPNRYQDIITSLVNLYKTGKKNWATKSEPSNTVRTEHTMVVLLDAYRKGYAVDFASIKDSLIKEGKELDLSKPDKALESCYDRWALSQILAVLNDQKAAKEWETKAAEWRTYWDKDFKDLNKKDVDEPEARKMYQGTIWQYRWFVPFGQKGLIEACGGEEQYLQQLNEFFAKDYYNAANEPDIQVPYLYNFTSQPWRSQDIILKYAKDTVIQYYQDENYRGIGAEIQRVYNNKADGLLQTMDEDMGAMSAWYVLAAIGLSPACPGYPVYYLHVPLFKDICVGKLHIKVKSSGRYIQSISLNDNQLDRNWLTQQEIANGGTLTIIASAIPNQNFGIRNQFMTALNKTQ
jgi:putative alpha-1,2-mannosidase